MNETEELNSAWHRGERAIQARVGVDKKMASIGEKVIRDWMPDQHREFFEQLSTLFIAAEDRNGLLWASILCGEPGFISTPTAMSMKVNAELSALDPLADCLQLGHEIGLLGIELHTRRRNRLNAMVVANIHNELMLSVKQSFGNCPKYIQLREVEVNTDYGNFERDNIDSLDKDLRAFIEQNDTFFIATRFCDGNLNRNRGVDVSHRGGAPGFIQFDEEGRMLIPDYSGNNFFNTIGNLKEDPMTALLFVDFQHGNIVQLNGTTEVLWAQDERLPFTNVERILRFKFNTGCVQRNVLPYIWTLKELSPFSEAYCQVR